MGYCTTVRSYDLKIKGKLSKYARSEIEREAQTEYIKYTTPRDQDGRWTNPSYLFLLSSKGLYFPWTCDYDDDWVKAHPNAIIGVLKWYAAKLRQHGCYLEGCVVFEGDLDSDHGTILIREGKLEVYYADHKDVVRMYRSWGGWRREQWRKRRDTRKGRDQRKVANKRKGAYGTRY